MSNTSDDSAKQHGRTTHPWLKFLLTIIVGSVIVAATHPFIGISVLVVSLVFAGLALYPAETTAWLHTSLDKLKVPEFATSIGLADFAAFFRGVAFVVVAGFLFLGIMAVVLLLFASHFDLFDMEDSEVVSNYEK